MGKERANTSNAKKNTRVIEIKQDYRIIITKKVLITERSFVLRVFLPEGCSLSKASKVASSKNKVIEYRYI